MTAEDLYQYMKDALDFFSLNWNEKNKIIVSFEEDYIIFSYNKMIIRIGTK